MANSTDAVITVLSTSVGETGNTQTVDSGFLKKDFPLRFQPDVGSGDTYVVEGKLSDSDDFETLATFTDDTPQDVFVSRIWRARRTVDGGNDGTLKVSNPFSLTINEHE